MTCTGSFSIKERSHITVLNPLYLYLTMRFLLFIFQPNPIYIFVLTYTTVQSVQKVSISVLQRVEKTVTGTVRKVTHHPRYRGGELRLSHVGFIMVHYRVHSSNSKMSSLNYRFLSDGPDWRVGLEGRRTDRKFIGRESTGPYRGTRLRSRQ